MSDPTPTPVNSSPSTIPVSTSEAHERFWLPDSRTYEFGQERDRHDEAMYQYGEYAYIALLWNIRDHDAGLVARCPECWIGKARVAEAYSQGEWGSECEACWGTTFEGGIRHLIVRPILEDSPTDDMIAEKGRGEVVTDNNDIQLVGNIRYNVGDYILRGDATRIRLARFSGNYITSGFQPAKNTISYRGSFALENPSRVIYRVGPTAAQLVADLTHINERRPKDFHSYETVRPGVYL